MGISEVANLHNSGPAAERSFLTGADAPVTNQKQVQASVNKCETSWRHHSKAWPTFPRPAFWWAGLVVLSSPDLLPVSSFPPFLAHHPSLLPLFLLISGIHYIRLPWSKLASVFFIPLPAPTMSFIIGLPECPPAPIILFATKQQLADSAEASAVVPSSLTVKDRTKEAGEC